MQIHIHNHDDKETKQRLRSIELTLTYLTRQGEHLMATVEDFKAKFEEVAATVDEIAADIADLVAKLAAGGMSADEEAATFADLSGLADKLKDVAATHTPSA